MIREDTEVPLEIAQLGDAPTNLIDDQRVKDQITAHISGAGYHVEAIIHVEYMPEVGSYFVKYRCSEYRRLILPLVIPLAALTLR